MGLRRQLLFTGYRFARATGVYHPRVRRRPVANVICLHRVNDDKGDDLTTPVSVFEQFLRSIKSDYNPISFRQLVESLHRREPIPANAVAITFDDGYRDNRTIAAPLLKQYDMPATFFVTSDYIGTDRVFPWDSEIGARYPMMSWDDVRDLANMGFDIGGHTMNHIDLGNAPLDVAEREIFGCKARIERELGREIHDFAYPFGRVDAIRDEVREIVRRCGFRSCVSACGGKVCATSDPFRLERVPGYQTLVEMQMELDGFMIYHRGRMSLHLTG